MLTAVKAIIEKNGKIRLEQPVHLAKPCRAIVTILDEKSEIISETAILNEASLSDWNRSEEDEAWSHLQKVQ